MVAASADDSALREDVVVRRDVITEVLERRARSRGALFPRSPGDRKVSAPAKWTIPEVRSALDARKISARELVKEFYTRIEQRNAELNIYLALSPERAYAQADRIDAAIAAGDALPSLAGVPIAVKDVISTHGIPTTCGSRILEGYKPPYDATAVTRLERAGAIILGKTNCDEFAMGSSNENSAYGPVRNPSRLTAFPAARAEVRRRRRRGPGRGRRSAPIPAARSGSRGRSAAFRR